MKQIFFFGLYFLLFSASLCAQSLDSSKQKKDSLQFKADSLGTGQSTDSVKPVVVNKDTAIFKNKILNLDAVAVSLAVSTKKVNGKDALFYIITALVLLLAFFRYFYSRYFTNLFRVFFNTSLRQSQLTDQLLQAKLPSLLFNFFFVLSAGIYVFVLLDFYHFIKPDAKWLFLLSSIAIMSLIFFIKYCTLKFTGWLTGLQEATDTYVFVVFLINKILGICLVPFIIILAFSDVAIVKNAALISLMIICIFLLLRFLRSYGLLQNQLKISKFHFILYVAGIELLPLLLIYKGLMIYLSKIV